MDIFHCYVNIMWVKQCHKPPMTGNGKHTNYIFMVMTGGMVFIIVSTFDHINSDLVFEPTNSKGFHQRISRIDIEISMV